MYTDDLDILLRQEVAEITIGELDEAIATRIGSDTRSVTLSWKTIHKQRKHHADIKDWDYAVLPHMIETGLVVQEHDNPERINIFFRDEPNRPFVTTIRVTLDGQRLYVLRLHRARQKTPKSLIKKGTVLRSHK